MYFFESVFKTSVWFYLNFFEDYWVKKSAVQRVIPHFYMGVEYCFLYTVPDVKSFAAALRCR